MIVAAAVFASGLGATARFVLAGSVQRRTDSPLPWGTAAVNVVGAVLLGVAGGLFAAGRLAGDPFTVVGVGFLGGFTTFSTWMVESVLLGEDGGRAGLVAMVANTLPILAAGVLGVAAGMQVGINL
jgi:CrcB protein